MAFFCLKFDFVGNDGTHGGVFCDIILTNSLIADLPIHDGLNHSFFRSFFVMIGFFFPNYMVFFEKSVIFASMSGMVVI